MPFKRVMQKPQVKNLDQLRLHLEHFYLERRVTLEVTARLAGLIFFIAFVGLLPQLNCLYGTTGLLPVTEYFDGLKGAHMNFFSYPTLLWLKPDVTGMVLTAISGVIASLLAFCNKAKTIALLVSYFCYFSLLQAGQDFLSFQWDILLLEVGFVSAFICSRPLSAAVKGLFAWLLILIGFKLMLLSGLCKLLSQDASWSGLTALNYHFYTQPLPTPLAAFIQALPQDWLKLLCGSTLFIELIIPLAVFTGRKGRLFAFASFIFLQVLIMISGNYGFFNWLSIVLFVPLLDDKAIAFYAKKERRKFKASPRSRQLIQWTGATLALCLISANLILLTGYIIPQPLIMRLLIAMPEHFYLVNSYGLFSVMTTQRPEIVIEGSNDGVHFSPYEFAFKPGNERRPPPLVAPYQPRLDWQLWFEALRATADENDLNRPLSQRLVTPSPWFINLIAALQSNDPNVTAALSFNPFKKQGPRYIRARIVQYKFATPAEILRDGIYWHSDFGGSRNIYFEN
ncbi:MAG: lipase maturation factor family protein [Candidatus Obscuribacter sp.]|nr:lipase maturation factor family protein [Candidatus Obscuribacter sp.]